MTMNVRATLRVLLAACAAAAGYGVLAWAGVESELQRAMPPLLAAIATMAISAGAIAGVTLTTTVFAGLTVGNLIFISTMVYGAVQQRKAEKRARANYNSSLSDRYAPVMSAAEAPWQIVYGEAPVGACQVAGMLTSGDRDQYKYVVYVWAAHECEAITDTLINGLSVGALDANGDVQPGSKWFKGNGTPITETHTPNGSGQVTVSRAVSGVISVTLTQGSSPDTAVSLTMGPGSISFSGTTITVNPAALTGEWAGQALQYTYAASNDGTPMLRVRHHLGTATQAADALLLAECPTEWTSADQLKGLCYSVFRYCLDETEFQGGPPQATVKLKGKKLYDARSGLTVWSDNAALATADFLRGEYGKAAASNQVDWATVNAAANVCDETLASQAGAKRYTCNGSFRTDGDPDSTLAALAQAMAGFATFDGTWALQAGAYTTPVMDLLDADNAGPVEVIADQAGDDVFNGLRGRFFDPARFDQLTDYTPYANAAYATADGGPIWSDLELPYTNAHWRAQNLARIQVERSRGMQLVFPGKLRLLKLRPGQRVRLWQSVLGISGATFRVVKRDFKLGQPVMVTLQQDAASHYDEADATAPLSSPAVDQPDPFVVAYPTGVACNSGDAYTLRATDGSVISRTRLSVNASTDSLVTSNGALQIEYRLVEEATFTRHPEASGSSTQVYLLGLLDNRAYAGRVRWRNGLGAYSAWIGFGVKTQGVITQLNWADISGRPSDADIRNNLVDTAWWKQDATIPWTTYGEYNRLLGTGTTGGTDVAVPGPKGGSDVVWYVNETTGDGGASGGWGGSPALAVDPTKGYRFVVPLRRLSGNGGIYWGCTDVAVLNGTTPAADPWFLYFGSALSDRWYLLVGFVYPAGSAGNTNESSGVWDCKTGLKVGGGNSYAFKAAGGVVQHRAVQSAATAGAEVLFGRPMVNAIDGTEPSLREYFEAGAVLNEALVPSITAAQNAANAAAAAASAASAAASTAQTTANAANSAIADSAADDKLSPVEKQRDKILWDSIVAEKAGIDAEADRYGITTLKTAYGTAYNTLSSYVTPLLADLSTTSTITGSTYRGNFSGLYTARQALLNKIAELAKGLADTAQSAANTAQTAANTAQAAANAAQSTANTAASSATSALSTLATIRSNGYLDAAEKPALAREWNAITGEYGVTTAQAGAYGITTERTAYDVAYSALSSYLSSLSPSWSDTTQDTPITPAVDQAKWSDYYAARGTLLNKIAAVAKTLADAAQSTANAASAAAATAQSTANTAASNATSALSTLATMRSNGYLDAAEKPAVIKQWNAVAGEYGTTSAQGATYGLTALQATYDAAYSALSSYLSSLSPGWSDTTTDTPITPAVDQTKWADYYNARQALLNGIADEAAKRAVWTQVTGTGKPADYATRDLTLVAHVGVTVTGNSVQKNSGTVAAWDAAAYSRESYAGGAYVSFSPAAVNQRVMVGLNTDPDFDVDWTSLDYAFYLSDVGGTMYAAESGSLVGPIGTYAAGDALAVTYDGATVRYYKAGVVLRAVPASITLPLYLDTSLADPGVRVDRLVFGPMSAVRDIGTTQISAGAATSVYTNTPSSAVTVTQTSFTPDNFSRNTELASVTVPAQSVACEVVVNFEGNCTFTNSSGSVSYCRFSVQDSGGTWDGWKSLYADFAGSVSGAKAVLKTERRFALPAGVSATYKAYACKLNSGDTCSVDNHELKVEVIKR